MQKCDGVLASGHNVTTFAIPALQPLVLTLFVRPSRESNTELDTQRYNVVQCLLSTIIANGMLIVERLFSICCFV